MFHAWTSFVNAYALAHIGAQALLVVAIPPSPLVMGVLHLNTTLARDTRWHVCVCMQAAEGSNRAAGSGMGAGLSLLDRPPGTLLEGRPCLAAHVWAAPRPCCHVCPCPHG